MPLRSNVPEADGPSVTLHSTWTGTLMSFLGAVLFMVFAVALFAMAGFGLLTLILVVVATAFFVVALFDLPVAAEFRPDGVVRRALLRHQFIEWDRVTRVRRMRTGIWSRKEGRGGGLLADVDGRKSMLIDTMESAQEFDEVRRVLGSDWSEALSLTDELRPPDGRSPTWLYRRDHWKPASMRKGAQQ